MELVQIEFHRRTILSGGALYLPGERATVTDVIAAQFCAEPDPDATLITSLDAPPLNKMVGSPAHKKGGHG